MDRLGELAAQIEADYRDEDGSDRDLLLVGVLGGAAVMTADLARAFDRHIEISWMGLSSYRAGPGNIGAFASRTTDTADRVDQVLAETGFGNAAVPARSRRPPTRAKKKR